MHMGQKHSLPLIPLWVADVSMAPRQNMALKIQLPLSTTHTRSMLLTLLPILSIWLLQNLYNALLSSLLLFIECGTGERHRAEQPPPPETGTSTRYITHTALQGKPDPMAFYVLDLPLSLHPQWIVHGSMRTGQTIFSPKLSLAESSHTYLQPLLHLLHRTQKKAGRH